ncbi:aspartate-semialdehyde dehydrogenase [Exiguobacterium algae]|uniref:aspartate-semialdehyde dehydrogenase n=1 Tax=Exiguobacterium algae TaxID=2751250 RepID=UPI001BE8678E|nr:aspartate-semialdehyde dehydrogenase [Exiguobacterium algae]
MYNVAVVGATGAVGQKMIEVLTEYEFPINELLLYASARSAGKTVQVNGQDIVIRELSDLIYTDAIDIALFSAGGSISEQYAPRLSEQGVIVIDNSSAFRMQEGIPLVVPEVNRVELSPDKSLIANPNCSTIQSVVALAPLSDVYGLTRVAYTSYQAVSGSGQKGIDDLERGAQGEAPQNYPYPIYNNVLPHIDVFLENGYTKEEQKMIDETRKILNAPDLGVTATCVRVPVRNSHAVSITVTLERGATLEEVRAVLADAPGVVLMDNPTELLYPTPLDTNGKDEVYVGRVRRDDSQPNTFHLWCVADNVRKGAAANAVQIAQCMIGQTTAK